MEVGLPTLTGFDSRGGGPFKWAMWPIWIRCWFERWLLVDAMTRRILEYCAKLEVTQGEGLGGPLRLFPWERRFLRGAFEPGVTSAALSVARGNGKSTTGTKTMNGCQGLPTFSGGGWYRCPGPA